MKREYGVLYGVRDAAPVLAATRTPGAARTHTCTCLANSCLSLTLMLMFICTTREYTVSKTSRHAVRSRRSAGCLAATAPNSQPNLRQPGSGPRVRRVDGWAVNWRRLSRRQYAESLEQKLGRIIPEEQVDDAICHAPRSEERLLATRHDIDDVNLKLDRLAEHRVLGLGPEEHAPLRAHAHALDRLVKQVE